MNKITELTAERQESYGHPIDHFNTTQGMYEIWRKRRETGEGLDPELDALNPLSWRCFWPSWNSLVELPDRNIMTCSPWTDNITIIDKATGDIKWRWGKE